MPSFLASLHLPLVRRFGRQLAAAETPEAMRAVFDATTRLLMLPLGTEVSETALGGISSLRVAARRQRGPMRTILMLHGGGYVFGSPRGYAALAARFAHAAHAEVVLPDYRLAPEAPHPAALDDALAAYRALLERRPPGGIALVGDSAGGGLVVATLQRARDEGLALPACAVLLSPWLDPSGSGASMKDNLGTEIVILPATIARCASWYAGGRDPAEPGIAPLFGTFEGLPPTLVQVSASEVLYSDATRFTERARAAGVEVTAEIEADLWHVWQTMAPTVPEARRSIDSAAGFVAGRARAA